MKGMMAVNFKKTVTAMGFIIFILVIMLAGHLAGLWEYGIEPWALVGLAAIIPSVIWAFAKGINFVNSGTYYAGIAYVIYRNFFKEFSAGFIVICVILFVAAVLMPLIAKKYNDANNDINNEIKE